MNRDWSCLGPLGDLREEVAFWKPAHCGDLGEAEWNDGREHLHFFFFSLHYKFPNFYCTSCWLELAGKKLVVSRARKHFAEKRVGDDFKDKLPFYG